MPVTGAFLLSLIRRKPVIGSYAAIGFMYKRSSVPIWNFSVALEEAASLASGQDADYAYAGGHAGAYFASPELAVGIMSGTKLAGAGYNHVVQSYGEDTQSSLTSEQDELQQIRDFIRKTRPSSRQELQQLRRELARRLHPDCHTKQSQILSSDMMAEANALIDKELKQFSCRSDR